MNAIARRLPKPTSSDHSGGDTDADCAILLLALCRHHAMRGGFAGMPRVIGIVQRRIQTAAEAVGALPVQRAAMRHT